MTENRTEKCAWHEKEITQLNAAVFGNGKEGLLEKVGKLQVTSKLQLGISVSILLCIIGMLTSMLIKHFDAVEKAVATVVP